MAPYSITVEVYRRLEEIIGKEATGIVVDVLQEVKTELQQEIDLVKTKLRKNIDLVKNRTGQQNRAGKNRFR